MVLTGSDVRLRDRIRAADIERLKVSSLQRMQRLDETPDAHRPLNALLFPRDHNRQHSRTSSNEAEYRMADERRMEPRHVVVGIDATLNGIPSAIVDISRSGVRLVRPAEFVADDFALIDFSLKEPGRSKPRSFRVEARLVRATAIDVSYIYAPPLRRWEAMLRAHDTFAQTALTKL